MSEISKNEIFIITQTVSAMITAMGMQAENDQRKIQGDSPAYVEKDFYQVILDHGIGHNGALELLNKDY